MNVGCVPSKAIIAAARVAATVRDAGEFGVASPEKVDVDFGAVSGSVTLTVNELVINGGLSASIVSVTADSDATIRTP